MTRVDQHVRDHEITILVQDSCPHRQLAVTRILHAARNLGATVMVESPEVQVVPDRESALALGFRGSPTFLIDGSDPFPVGLTEHDGSLACRLYPTDRGLEGAPSVEQLEEALRR